MGATSVQFMTSLKLEKIASVHYHTVGLSWDMSPYLYARFKNGIDGVNKTFLCKVLDRSLMIC